jgi:hypothetical protein
MFEVLGKDILAQLEVDDKRVLLRMFDDSGWSLTDIAGKQVASELRASIVADDALKSLEC